MVAREKEKCLIPGCTNLAASRGQCKSCLAATRAKAKKDPSIWEKLYRKGYARPPRVSRVEAALKEKPQGNRSPAKRKAKTAR